MRTFKRSDRVGSLIQKNVADILMKGIKDPRLETTVITGVKMSDDLKYARIYFSISGGGSEGKKKEVSEGFRSARGYIKRTLASQLGLRYMPELQFSYDDSLDYGSHIDKLLREVQETEASNPKTWCFVNIKLTDTIFLLSAFVSLCLCG